MPGRKRTGAKASSESPQKRPRTQNFSAKAMGWLRFAFKRSKFPEFSL
jgi:hypothetical protein